MRRIAPRVLLGLILAGVAVLLTFDELTERRSESVWVDVGYILALTMCTAVGMVLATRRSENPIGWLLLVNGLVLALTGVASNYALYGLEHPGSPGAAFAAVFDTAIWPMLFAPLAAIAFVFPDGRLPSPRWRRIAVGSGVLLVLMLVLLFLAPRALDEPYGAVTTPLPQLPEAIFNPLFVVASIGTLAALFAAAYAVRTRLRRATGDERRQIKLLAYAAASIPLAVACGWAESLITGSSGEIASASAALPLVGIPLAIGVAVMRYRLYEVDRLVNRTLVYATLTVLLAATYGAVSLGLGVALGSGSTLATAAATLTVALVFGRLRGHVQRIVDRRFNRPRYEGLRRVERHLADLRAGRASPEQTGAALAEALGDPDLALVYAVPGESGYVDASGLPTDVAPDDERDVTLVRRGDLALGAVLHDRALNEHPDVLESVINAAGLAIEIARLSTEVRRRLAEVEQSRARIVTAGYEERRRLERDLHDGAQQRLVSIGLAIRHVQGQLGAHGDAFAADLDATVTEVTRAIEELRELARGVRPACLDDGLAPALRELAARAPLRTEVAATSERFAEPIEAAAYFVASEALTNSVKHARASLVTVSAERANGSLVLRITDDGIGGATASARSGLAGITDRVAALGGSVSVSSPRGEGTAVVAELPCAS
ncbi:MAG: histidine kinase [Solirubrobacteraceae bacterium]|nr:histidine kinase [Solirubrobacteraceae bacterium]